MSDTIWIHQARPRTPWYTLDETKRNALIQGWERLDQDAKKDGAEFLGRYSVRGQSDFSTVEVWKFSAPEHVHDFWHRRVDADYAAWFAFSNQLGTSPRPVKTTDDN